MDKGQWQEDFMHSANLIRLYKPKINSILQAKRFHFDKRATLSAEHRGATAAAS